MLEKTVNAMSTGLENIFFGLHRTKTVILNHAFGIDKYDVSRYSTYFGLIAAQGYFINSCIQAIFYEGSPLYVALSGIIDLAYTTMFYLPNLKRAKLQEERHRYLESQSFSSTIHYEMQLERDLFAPAATWYALGMISIPLIGALSGNLTNLQDKIGTVSFMIATSSIYGGRYPLLTDIRENIS